MSTVKLCDRCNKKVSYRRSVAFFKPIFINAALNVSMFREGINIGGDGLGVKFDERQFDLCEDCTNKFIRFMDGAELVINAQAEDECDNS